MTVYISNFYKKKIIGKEIYCGRPKNYKSVGYNYGNPFPMSSEDERDKVCEEYQEYFDNNIITDAKLNMLMETLLETAKYTDITLVCFCHPKRCHTETIKTWLDTKLKEESNANDS